MPAFGLGSPRWSAPMKNVLSLLVIAAVLGAGWMNRDKIRALWSNDPTAPAEAAAPGLPFTAPAQVGVTPHPAREAQVQAKAIYPGLALPNSALNKKFLALYKEAQSSDTALLSRPDWPLQLADRA